MLLLMVEKGLEVPEKSIFTIFPVCFEVLAKLNSPMRVEKFLCGKVYKDGMPILVGFRKNLDISFSRF